MKKKIRLIVQISAVSLFLVISACKSNDRITPSTKGGSDMAGIPVLTSYLANILSVSGNEIVYNRTTQEFIIRSTIVIKEKQVQDNYRIANEYKLKNGITNQSN